MKKWCRHITISDILFLGTFYTWDEPVRHGVEAKLEWFIITSSWTCCPICGTKRPVNKPKKKKG